MTINLDQLRIHEGFSPTPYQDHLGYYTIGIGTLMRTITEEELEYLGYESLDEIEEITEDQAEYLLESRAIEYVSEFVEKWPEYLEQPECVQEALSDMCYQLGVSGLLEFKRMLKALKNKDYGRAIVEAKDSKWANQTPTRFNYVKQQFNEAKAFKRI